MVLSRRVSLGGEQLDEIHDAIVIRSVDPGVPDEAISTVNLLGRSGQRVTGRRMNVLEASVTWAMDVPKRQIALRREIFDAVTRWARRSGWLETNEMPGKMMYADAAVIQSGGDMWQWTNEYTITFRAYAVPYWQDLEAAVWTAEAVAAGSVAIDAAGTEDTVLDVAFRNVSGAEINSFKVTAGDSVIDLAGIALAADETIRITHGTDDILRVTAGSRSLYPKIRPGSSGRLKVAPGRNVVTVTAQRAGDLTVSCRGRYV